MSKKVNNINYKGIAHTPSLVSDNDGVASECANLAPDNGDLKPMPMPVKVSSTYIVTSGCKIIYIHKGIGYENYVELYEDDEKLFIRDSAGRYLYAINAPDFLYWTNESEIVAVEAMGDTLVVSTMAGTEYLVYHKDIANSALAPSSYKWIGQKPPMPVIEFQLDEEKEYVEVSNDVPSGEDSIIKMYHAVGTPSGYYYQNNQEEVLTGCISGAVAKLAKRISSDAKFYQPFFVRYAIRTKTGDYFMQSPVVLMLPANKEPSVLVGVQAADLELLGAGSGAPGNYGVFGIKASSFVSRLTYKVVSTPLNTANASMSDWYDIIDCVDVFVSEPIYNYDIIEMNGNTNHVDSITVYKDDSFNTKSILYVTEISTDTFSLGDRFVDGEIREKMVQTDFSYDDTLYYRLKGVDTRVFDRNIESSTLFHRVASIGLNEIVPGGYIDLPIENLTNLATLPTLTDDYNTHCAVSPSLMQTYNNRLNMANISQKVFNGFENAYQPQSENYRYDYVTYIEPGHIEVQHTLKIHNVYFKVKKNGKTYVVENNAPTTLGKLDYSAYLYYPDPDCYEAVIRFQVDSNIHKYYTVPMKRHEYLNGAYWYGNMDCLGEFIRKNALGSSETYPGITQDLWYELPNRFMMSSVGNPWHFPVDYMKEIGVGEIRSLTFNPENMNAPQYGQNPIYVFSTDGVWTVSINNDGTPGKLSYVSGDVVSEMQTLGASPTASAEQLTFFKTSRGIMMMSGSSLKEIDLCMKGRIFNPKTQLLPANTVFNGIPSSGESSTLEDLIKAVCDDVPYADFARDSSLVYDYINKRLMLYNGKHPYMYVYDLRYDFWSKMIGVPLGDSQQVVTRGEPYTVYVSMATSGAQPIVQDSEGYLWTMGDQTDENNITARQLGFYVSKPMRFGTDDFKTLTRIVHNKQAAHGDSIGIALYGSRDGGKYYRVGTLRGTSYKFFVIVLYTCMLPSSRYAYTAFEWEPRLANKIR